MWAKEGQQGWVKSKSALWVKNGRQGWVNAGWRSRSKRIGASGSKVSRRRVGQKASAKADGIGWAGELEAATAPP